MFFVFVFFLFCLLKCHDSYLHQKINDLRRPGTLFPHDLPICRYWGGFLVVYCSACLCKNKNIVTTEQ